MSNVRTPFSWSAVTSTLASLNRHNGQYAPVHATRPLPAPVAGATSLKLFTQLVNLILHAGRMLE